MSRIELPLILTLLTATLVLACDQATPTQPSSLTNPAAPPGLSTASQMPDFDPNDSPTGSTTPSFR